MPKDTQGLENPFAPGGAYAGGASLLSTRRWEQNYPQQQLRQLKALEQAIYNALRNFNNYRTQINAPEALMRLVLPENEPEYWQEIKMGLEIGEEDPNPFLAYDLAELIGFAAELGLPDRQQATLTKYIEAMKDNERTKSGQPVGNRSGG